MGARMLLMALLLSTVAGCGETPVETTETDTNAVETAADTESLAVTDMEGRLAVTDGLPEKDFGGANYTILGYNLSGGTMVAEELNGEAFNDAVYNRNAGVEERFQVKLQVDYDHDYLAASTALKNTVLAGESTYDLVAYQYVQMGSDVVSNVYLNFRDVPYIDFEKPWWNYSTDELLTYKGRTFLALGSLSLSNISGSNCIYYNQGIAEQYELEDIFAVVNEGRWTLDKLLEFSDVVYKDVNGDGVRDEGDQYGFVYSRKGDMGGIQVYDKLICDFDSEGNLMLDKYYDEKLVSIVEKLYDIQYNHPSVWSEEKWNLGIDLFVDGTVLAGFGNLSMSQWGLRETEIDYAIIPIPKWDEAQEKYYTCVGGDAQAVIQTAGDLEKIGVITEALNAESWRTCESAYYENTIKYKTARQEENIAVLDMMMENRVYDFATVYGGWSEQGGGANFWIYQLLNSDSTDIASYYQSKKARWEQYMADVVSAFENYKN